MTYSRSYSTNIITYLSLLLLPSILFASLATRLAIVFSSAYSDFENLPSSARGDDSNPYHNLPSASILLSFAGFMILGWTVALITMAALFRRGRQINKRVVDPLPLLIQAIVLWVLIFAGAVTLSARDKESSCIPYRNLFFITGDLCSLSRTTQGFAYMALLVLTLLIIRLVFFAKSGAEDQSSSKISLPLHRPVVVERPVYINTYSNHVEEDEEIKEVHKDEEIREGFQENKEFGEVYKHEKDIRGSQAYRRQSHDSLPAYYVEASSSSTTT